MKLKKYYFIQSVWELKSIEIKGLTTLNSTRVDRSSFISVTETRFPQTPPLLKILVIVLLSRCKCEEEFEIVQKNRDDSRKTTTGTTLTTFLDRESQNEIAQEILF